MKDSFIIYSQADRVWAEWIAWQLNLAHYSTIVPVWGVLPDSDIEMELQKASAKAKRTIIILSPYYLKSLAINSAWLELFRREMLNPQNSLIPVYVRASRGKYRKLELLMKHNHELLASQHYYMYGQALLEVGFYNKAHEAFKDALALVDDRQKRLTLLLDCANLMASHGMWNDVLSYANEALLLLPHDLNWLSIQLECVF